MNLIKRSFISLHPAFLIKSYIIATVLFTFFTWSFFIDFPTNIEYTPLVIMGLDFLLFPFAYLVYNDLRASLFSNESKTSFFGSGLLLVIYLIIKFFITLLLYGLLFGFSIIIGPIGLIYLNIQNNKISLDEPYDQ